MTSRSQKARGWGHVTRLYFGGLQSLL